jgi:dihydroorotate dehydrogenase (NAD+) catalytic subunit
LVSIATKIASLKMRNPTILASGIMGQDAGSMRRAIESGAGAVVTKSIGLQRREGYPNPTVVELEYGILNAMGLPNPGVDCFGKEIEELKEFIVIGSIYGKDAKEFAKVASKMQEYGVSALELNLSCPHVKKYGEEVGCDPDTVEDIVSRVKECVSIPVFAKLSPNVNIKEIAESAERGGADALVAINAVKGMIIDIDVGKPILYNKVGGYSGKGIKPIGIRCVFEIRRSTNIPIIGAGGITTGEDAIQYFMAGASAIEIGTGVYYRGLNVFKKVCTEIKEWMERQGYKEIGDIVGIAHEDSKSKGK